MIDKERDQMKQNTVMASKRTFTQMLLYTRLGRDMRYGQSGHFKGTKL